MLPDKMEHCIVFMNSWDVSGVFWSFSKCKIKIPHLPADPSSPALPGHCGPELLDGPRRSVVRVLTCSGSSKLAKMLFQVCPAPR